MIRPQSRAPNRSRWANTPPRRVVSTWYVAIVTGRISLRSPEYSPISSSVSDVRATSSRFHCRPATVFVTRISVVAFAVAIAAAPTRVLPAPHGSTTTPGAAGPEPLHRLALVRAQRPAVLGSSIWCASPSTYPARSSAGQPSFSRPCLSRPRSDGCTAIVSSSTRAPSMPASFLLLATSTSTARSSALSTSPCDGSFTSCSRPYRSIVSATSTSSACGTG